MWRKSSQKQQAFMIKNSSDINYLDDMGCGVINSCACPLELTIRSAAHRVMRWESDGRPTLNAFIITLPHKLWVNAERDRLPTQGGQGRVTY